MRLLLRWKSGFVIAGLLLIVLGLRISVGIRFVTQLPQPDDYRTLFWLQNISKGIYDWSYLWYRPNGHLFVFYDLINLLEYKLNGYWDPRIDFLTYAFIHTVEAAVILLTFRGLLSTRDRWWIYALVLFLCATPFGGYRIGWGDLYLHTCDIIFALPAIYLVVYGGSAWAAAIGAVVVAALGSLNMAAGCLGALTIAVFVVFRGAVNRRLGTRDLVLALATFLIFVICFATMPKSTGPKIGLLEGLNALLKAIAWPVVFTPLAGFATLIPLAGLAGTYVLKPRFRQPAVEFTLGAGILVCLLALATGAFRGDEQNMGMPSGRYTDLFLIVPLVSIVALALLCRGTAGPARQAWMLYAWLWFVLQVGGFSIHVLYRTLPFLANQTGEWVEPAKLESFRAASRDPSIPLIFPPDPHYDPSLDVSRENQPAEKIAAYVRGTENFPAMTTAMIAGFPLMPGQGNFIAGGYAPSYSPWLGENYVGSFDRDNRRTPKFFTSRPFRPQAPYLMLDLLVEKKARFSNYRLPGLDLALVDQTTGSRLELLPRLAHTFPFVFRDWESIEARVTPGHTYVLEASASDATPQDWLAFSEPIESGYLTPLLFALIQSGKFMCLIGLSLLALAAGLHRGSPGLFGETAATDAEGARS